MPQPALSAAGLRAQPAAQPQDAAARQVLLELALVRALTIGALGAAIGVVHYFLAAPGPLVPTASIVALLACAAVATLLRLRSKVPVTQLELAGQLAFDVLALTAFFYPAGGATNPFVDLFLLPLALAAARLSRGPLLVVAVLTLGCYLLLSVLFQPLPPAKAGVGGFHCFGMWVKYVVVAGFVGVLISSLASRLREGESRLAAAARRTRRDEVFARAGSLAAGAVHELRSPLCTMAVLVNELQRETDKASAARMLRTLATQIDACGHLVGELVRSGEEPAHARGVQPVDVFVHDTVEKWRALRPNASLVLRRAGIQPPPTLETAGTGLSHAILSLLNNAADASPGAVEMDCAWTARELSLCVLDRGPGIPPELVTRVGEPYLSSKRESGTGIGLALAKGAAERAGGRLEISARPGGGTIARIAVPLGEIGDAVLVPGASAGSYMVRYFRSPSAGRA